MAADEVSPRAYAPILSYLLERAPPSNKRRLRISTAFRRKNVNKRCIHPAIMWRLLIFDMATAEMLIWLILLLLLLLFALMWRGI